MWLKRSCSEDKLEKWHVKRYNSIVELRISVINTFEMRITMLEPKIEIDHNRILSNLSKIQERLDRNVKVMAVVKSNAYGHGMIEVSKTLEKHVDMLGVGFLEEGIDLRRHIKSDIFVMGPVYDFDTAIENDLIITMESVHQFTAMISFFEKRLRESKDVLRIHLKVDTGMHRFGMNLDEIKEVLNIFENKKCESNVSIEGVFSHFAGTSLLHKKSVEEQYKVFKKVKDYMKNHYHKPLIYHIANSENGLDSMRYNEDMVRIGNGLYGGMALENPLDTKCVAKVLLPIMSIHVLKETDTFGYGFKKKAKKGTKLGAVKTGFYEGTGMGKMPIGQNIRSIVKFYVKGLIKALLRKEAVTYGALTLPIVGTVNMQFFQIDLTGTNIMVGDFVEYKKAPLYYKESVKRVHIREGRNGTNY